MSRIHATNPVAARAVLVLAAGVLVAACGGTSPSPSSAAPAPPVATQAPASTPAPESPAGGEPSPAPGGAVVEVSIAGFAFSPAAVTVNVGGTVTWTHADGAPHTVTADGGAFESARMGQGDTFSNTFPAAGSFPYHCAIHPSMTGTVTVTP